MTERFHSFPRAGHMTMDAYPSYTLAQLEKFVAEGKGTPAMVKEIEDRKSGASKPKVTPQILGGKVQTKLGRM